MGLRVWRLDCLRVSGKDKGNNWLMRAEGLGFRELTAECETGNGYYASVPEDYLEKVLMI